ncbi:glycine receptor subunit alpha-2-like isoform X2 [Centruroides vittatus]
MKVIPDDYNPDAPPMINNLPTSLYISFEILEIDKIHEATMDFRLLLLLVVVWKDPRLNLKHLVSHRSRIFPSDLLGKIWIPKFGYPNTKMIEKIHKSSHISWVKILPDESLIGFLRLNFLVDCPMNLRDYPIDVQQCQFFFCSIVDDKKVILRWMGEANSPYRYFSKSINIRHVNLLTYEMGEVKDKKMTQVWLKSNFTVLFAEFTFKRRLTGNLMNVYIPSSLVVMLSWLSFWIDVHAAPARVTLGVTSILTLVTHLVQSRSFVPPVDYLKALDIWFIFCIVLIFLSLLEYAVAYQSAIKARQQKKETQRCSSNTDPKKGKDPGKIQGWVSHWKDIKKTLIDSKHVNAYDKVSRYVFPFVFINFVSFYWIYYLALRI